MARPPDSDTQHTPLLAPSHSLCQHTAACWEQRRKGLDQTPLSCTCPVATGHWGGRELRVQLQGPVGAPLPPVPQLVPHLTLSGGWHDTRSPGIPNALVRPSNLRAERGRPHPAQMPPQPRPHSTPQVSCVLTAWKKLPPLPRTAGHSWRATGPSPPGSSTTQHEQQPSTSTPRSWHRAGQNLKFRDIQISQTQGEATPVSPPCAKAFCTALSGQH